MVLVGTACWLVSCGHHARAGSRGHGAGGPCRREGSPSPVCPPPPPKDSASGSGALGGATVIAEPPPHFCLLCSLTPKDTTQPAGCLSPLSGTRSDAEGVKRVPVCGAGSLSGQASKRRPVLQPGWEVLLCVSWGLLGPVLGLHGARLRGADLGHCVQDGDTEAQRGARAPRAPTRLGAGQAPDWVPALC